MRPMQPSTSTIRSGFTVNVRKDRLLSSILARVGELETLGAALAADEAAAAKLNVSHMRGMYEHSATSAKRQAHDLRLLHDLISFSPEETFDLSLVDMARMDLITVHERS